MIKLTYRSFGQTAPEIKSRFDYVLLLLLCTIFVVLSLAITVVLNFFSLIAGVMITFLGREGAQFKFLKLFDRIPVIAIALPALFGFAIWHQSTALGLVHTLWPMVAVWALAGFSVFILAIVGVLRGN